MPLKRDWIYDQSLFEFLLYFNVRMPVKRDWIADQSLFAFLLYFNVLDQHSCYVVVLQSTSHRAVLP
jgi:hypothetical protein